MTKSLIIPALAGAALLIAQVAGAHAQTRTVIKQQPFVPAKPGFAVKNGGAFANQGGIAAQAKPVTAGKLIGENTGTWMKPGSAAGILSPGNTHPQFRTH